MIDDIDLFGEKINPASSILGIRFGVPPFSVLSAREGEWQERKRRWLALGIQSELGRGGVVPGGGGGRQSIDAGQVSRMAMHNDPIQRKIKYGA